jgi:peptidoglycan/xylan/chitin deacetylase (PgdA/CDA1 family)
VTPDRIGRVRARVLALLVAAVTVPAACSSSDSTNGAAGHTPTRATTTTTLVPVTTTPPASTLPPTTVPAVPTVVANGPRDKPNVALTFDSNLTDAMIRELDTRKVASFANVAVLDELDQLHVPATMFLAGKWMERYPDVTRRIVGDPLFEVGSHSYAHRAFHLPCYGLGGLSAFEMAADVAHSEALLRQFTPNPTPYFRFPGGCFDEGALRAIAPTGVTVIQYDVASGDAFGRSVQAIVRNVLGHVQNGSIVVMHITDGNTAPLTAQALPDVVQGLRARGFTLVKISTLLQSA